MKRFKYLRLLLFVFLGLGLFAGVGGLDFLWLPPLKPAKIPATLRHQLPRFNRDGSEQWGSVLTFNRYGITACELAGPPEIRGAARHYLFSHSRREIEKNIIYHSDHYPFLDLVAHWVKVRWFTFQQLRLLVNLPEEIRREFSGYLAVKPKTYLKRWYYMEDLWFGFLPHELDSPGTKTSLASGIAFGIKAWPASQQHLLLAYKINWEKGEILDQRKLVELIRPEQGMAFIALAWPGLLGTLAGMNEAGVALAWLPGHSRDHRKGGLPVSLLCRQVLTQAQTLAQAISLLQNTPSSSSASFLLGAKAENRVVVVEKTPQRMAIRELSEDAILACDYFLSPEFSQDDLNRYYQKSGPSAVRLFRAKELLQTNSENRGEVKLIKLLRDNRGQFDIPLGLGNQGAINALTPSYAVVFDLTTLTAWVSAHPSPLGLFVPFTFENFSPSASVQPLPADGLLISGAYQIYLQYEKSLAEAKAFLKTRHYQEALAGLMELHPVNPRDYRFFWFAGQALKALKRWDEAAYNFDQALKLHPAFRQERQEIEEQLQELKKKAR